MVADPPDPLPTTPLRASRSEVWIGRSGRTRGCPAVPASRTSRALERSSSNNLSISPAKPGSSATRSISQLATRLATFRFVEPTFDHPHVDPVAGDGHQGLGEDRHGEEVGVGDP